MSQQRLFINKHVRNYGGLALFSFFCSLISACSFSVPEGQAPASQGQSWVPEEKPQTAEILSRQEESDKALIASVGAAIGQLPREVSLAELLQYALQTNPLTRGTWLNTQAAYASVGIERSNYYPKIDVGAQDNRSRQVQSSSDSNGQHIVSQQTKGGSFALANWLLYDFGNREARIDEQKQALIAANYSHNAAVQQVVLELQRAFYQYLAARYLARSQEVGVKDAEVNFDAAERRRSAGLATIADVLQAKTALSRAKYLLQSIQGQVASTRGAVLTAAGLPPSMPVDIKEVSLDELPALGDIEQGVEKLIEVAIENNPGLAAARAKVAQAESHLQVAKTKQYPSIQLSGRYDQIYHSPETDDNYTAGVSISYPLFTGFSRSYEEMKARMEAERAVADYKLAKDARNLDVWTDYYGCKTAMEQIKTSADLFDSATKSYEVALGRYNEGVGNIIDLLSSQTALEQARAAKVKSYADWFISLAQLNYDLGALTSPTSGLPAEEVK